MPLTRRDSLRLALASPWLLHAWPKSSDWSILHRLPRSQSFGVTKEGKPRDAVSLYRVGTKGGAELTFDISNQQILASLDRDGAIRRVCVNDGLAPLPESAVSGGVYNAKLHRRGGPWKIARKYESETAVELLGNVIPEFSWRQKNLSIRQVSFAPMDAGNPARAPRALFTILVLENQGTEEIEYKLQWESSAPPQFLVSGDVVTLEPGARRVIEFAMCLEADEALEKRLRSRSPQEWFEESYRTLTERYGALEIFSHAFPGESLTRYAENCRQSMLHLPDGKFGGGFMGSDGDTRDNNWNKDTYYCTLGAGMSDPSLVARAIPYYFLWGLSAKPTARGLARFPQAGAITQSLSLAVAPLALAATYYRWSGDRDYFLRNPAFLTDATARAKAVLETRRGDVFLFPSMFISNGDARGHYHTGSNVTAWYAFDGLARLAREVYRDESEARKWSAVAAQVARAIEEYCISTGSEGPQFVEGVYEDRTYVPGHDGEESDTTLMPFYRFREADGPELIRHARVGLSPQNPYYAPELDGIWWHNHGGFRPATAPAWATGLAAAGNRKELRDRMERFRELSDLDGSIWWWPYRYGEKERGNVLRGNGATKCGWASAIYLLRFVENILGARVDVPSRTLRFSPFVPWEKFRWRDARLGTARFDLDYASSPQGQVARIGNRNLEPYRVQCCLTARDGMLEDLQSKQGGRRVRYYGLPALEVEMIVNPGETVEFRAA